MRNGVVTKIDFVDQLMAALFSNLNFYACHK